MKKFTDYLKHTKKKYQYKVKLAVEDFDVDHLKRSFQKFNVIECSEVRRTPIQRNPVDFPTLPSCRVHIIDVTLEYPTISRELEFIIHQSLGIEMSHIKVSSGNDASEQYNNNETSPIAGRDYPASPDNQDLVGQRRITDFLKNLTTGNYGVDKTLPPEFLPDAKPSSSVIGSTKRN